MASAVGVATAVVRAKRTRTSHMGGRLPMRDFLGGHRKKHWIQEGWAALGMAFDGVLTIAFFFRGWWLEY